MITQSDNQTKTLSGYTLVPYTPLDAGIIEKALTVGDVAKMDSPTRVHFYRALCQSTGLNPLTRPFILLKTPSGELTWYATVGAAEQLRKLHRVSTRILSRERTEEGLYIVTVQASAPDGRQEESQGIVFVGGLKGQELGNAMMRAGSKALRRVTLALCGLGMAGAEEESGQVIAFDPQTGTVELPPPAPEAEALLPTIGAWFRQRPAGSRETIARGVWNTEMRQIPHLSQEELQAGWNTIDQGYALLDWNSDTLEADLAAWRQAHAQQAILDVFERSEGKPEETTP